MKGRNCPNCGAALDSAICKCSYCGTSYFDISAIDIDSGTPFYLKMRTKKVGKQAIVTTLVRASAVDMTWYSTGEMTINLELQGYIDPGSVKETYKVELMEEEE